MGYNGTCLLYTSNDGRKLALDQRMMNELLPDYPESKVNACVEEVYNFWEHEQEKRLTQLVFCDLSTPKTDGSFSVYKMCIRDRTICLLTFKMSVMQCLEKSAISSGLVLLMSLNTMLRNG